jgi:peptidylprolyl isomerase
VSAPAGRFRIIRAAAAKSGGVTTRTPTGTFPLSRRPLRAAALALSAVLALAACGGGSKNNSEQAAPPAATDPAAPVTAATPSCNTPTGTNPFPTPSALPAGSGDVPGMPAVTANATNFDSEPTIAKGTGAPPKGLAIRDLIVGSCQTAGPSDTVNVRYVGALYSDGTVFDASWKTGSAPVKFSLSGVVPGFAGGIVGMKAGGRREIYIPSYLGYGPQGTGPIPPNSALVFVVDLVSIL